MDHTSPTVDKEENQQEEDPMGRALVAQKEDMVLMHGSSLDDNLDHQPLVNCQRQRRTRASPR